jgi:hypothetical protein
VQRPQGPGREQRVTGPEQEPGVRRLPLGELPDQHRLADAGLARHQHDPASGGRRGQHAGQLAQHRGALQQIHNLPTLPRAAPAFQHRASPPAPAAARLAGDLALPVHTPPANPPTTARVCSGTMASGGKLPTSHNREVTLHAWWCGAGNRAAELTQQANDLQQLEPMLAATAATLAAAGVPERPGEAAGGRRLLDDRQPDPDSGRAGAADPPSGTAARASALPTLPRHPRQPRRAHHPCVTRSTRRW